MTWTSVGIGASILGAILAIVFWVWPRAKAKGALRGATATIGHTSNIGNVIVGSGNVVHALPSTSAQLQKEVIEEAFRLPKHEEEVTAAPESHNPDVNEVPREYAGITPSEFSRLLKAANAFKKRDLYQFYDKKRFLIAGHIDCVTTMAATQFSVSLKREADVNISVRFPVESYRSTFNHINSEGWYLDVEAELDPLWTYDDIFFFHKPTNVHLKPVA
jgi:hypothetical protein